MTDIDRCKIISLPRHNHPNGTIAVVENDNSLPFAIKRVFYIYDIPSGSERGGHAHIEGEQLIIAASGSFEVTVSNGRERRKWLLRNPGEALFLPSGLWVELADFSNAGICLTLCSVIYDESDYIRDYDSFLKYYGI